ncbi:MAG: hypothetical protein JWO24_4182 [Rhodospirillales bacterium]|nr:hypothetical protein [Rhodospirillales bacterium]
MYEIHRCPDGREAVLTFNEDTLRVEATTREGETIGQFQFALVGADGEMIDLMDDSGEAGEAVALKLAQGVLSDDWRGRGIRERAVMLVADETKLEPVQTR